MDKVFAQTKIGQVVTLTMNGQHLKGTWEVKLIGLPSDNSKFKKHAIVEWQKPAMEAFGKKADDKPTRHYVPLASIHSSDEPAPKQKAIKRVDLSKLDEDTRSEILNILNKEKPKTQKKEQNKVVNLF